MNPTTSTLPSPALNASLASTGALRELKLAIESAVTTSGVTARESHVMSVAAMQLCRVAGFQMTLSTPALEGVGSPEPLKDTELALEGLAETAKKVWDHILEMIKKAIEWAKIFFNKINTRSLAAHKRAEKLAEAVGSLKATPKTSQISDERFAGVLSIDGSYPASMVQEAARVADFAGRAFDNRTSLDLRKITESLGGQKPAHIASEMEQFKVAYLAQYTHGLTMRPVRNDQSDRFPVNTTEFGSIFLGNYAVTVRGGTPAFVKVEPPRLPTGKLRVLSKDEMLSLIDAVRQMLGHIESHQARRESIERGLTTLFGNIKKIRETEVTNVDELEMRQDAGAKAWEVSRSMQHNDIQIMAYLHAQIDALLNYVEVCANAR